MDEEVKIEETIPEGVEDIKDDVYRLQEMADEMTKSLANLNKVKIEQQYLIDALTKLNDEKLSGLVNELTAQLSNIDNQIALLTTRQHYVASVCDACDNDDTRQLVNNLLAGLGVFPQA